MPGMDGLTLLGRVNRIAPALPVIVVTAHTDLENAVAAYQGGAGDTHLGGGQLKLKPGEEVEPGQVGIGQQQGVTTGRARGGHGPGVGAGLPSSAAPAEAPGAFRHARAARSSTALIKP